MALKRKKMNPLEAARWEAHLTRKELSELSGVNCNQIQRYENGTSAFGNMTMNNAVALSDALELDLVDLYNRFLSYEQTKRKEGGAE